jgi:hypothetical protein
LSGVEAAARLVQRGDADDDLRRARHAGPR